MEWEDTESETGWAPPPPEGYDLHDPVYVQPWYVTVFLGAWGVGAFVGVPLLVVAIKGLDTALTIYKDVLLPTSFAEAAIYGVWIFATLIAMVTIHEALHAIIGRALGYKTEFSIEKYLIGGWTPQVVTYGRFMSRLESTAITLAPLLIITPVSIAIVVIAESSWIVATAAYVAFGNLAGSVADLGAVWVLSRLPAGELFYHDSTGRRQYYTPTGKE
jgi:hypothetical protein